MKIKKTELKENIDSIWEISTFSKECFGYAFYFHKPETEDESEFLNESRDFKFIRHILWRMTIIELSKLFSNSKNDVYNLNHFINKLKRNQSFGDIGILEEKIQNWEKILLDNQKLIKNVLNLRNKVYAHKDRKNDDLKLLDIRFKEIEILINLSEEIITEIHSVAFDSDVRFKAIYFNKDRFNLIKILAEEKKNRRNRVKKGNLG
ncbi:hypothetical protein [Flavobacterium taihuense]|uniref:HEPN AbiU2-like domain-containing protein n=1 Tax=Flavobacterium taihuense TaxID=2857508 RepID=A0ABS6XU80_9FLAO|nr:hypothetical protein [Flavobacterium taihuense]MBW4360239.1 hypothetical protein [Flavobacterium taihuense]